MLTPLMLQAHIAMMILLMSDVSLLASMTVMVLSAAGWAVTLKHVLWIPIPEVRIWLVSGGSVAAPLEVPVDLRMHDRAAWLRIQP